MVETLSSSPSSPAPADGPAGSPPAASPPRAGWRGPYRPRPDRLRRGERWTLPARAVRLAFCYPQLVLRALGADPSPVVRDGRVLHPGLQALIAVAAKAEGSAPASLEAEAMRAESTRLISLAMPTRDDIRTWGRTVPGVDGAPDIPVRCYRPFDLVQGGPGRPATGTPAVVYFHGGGFVIGDLETHDGLCRLLAAAARCTVIAVDYRLAPECPFPAAVDDCLAAYRWAAAHHAELGVDPARMGVMGDSAGGNLAAVVAREVRDEIAAGADLPLPVVQGLCYPAVDIRGQSPSMQTLGEGFLLTSAQMEFFKAAYVPDPATHVDPRVSPAAATDLAGLPPAVVVTAGFDPLRDEGLAYADALTRAGVPVEARCYDDMVHGFLTLGVLPDALAVTTEVCILVGRYLRP